jgi:N-acetylglucosaminyl-diphospho-decaprenol L-rhamnosyltransferase
MTALMPDVVVSVVYTSNPDLVADCLRSLYAATRAVSFEVWVVDNATDGCAVDQMRTEFPQVRWLVNAKRLGFSANHNQVLSQARGRYYCVLNDDTVIHERALDELVAYMDAHPQAGVTGPRLLNPDGTIQLSTFRFPGLVSELAGLCYLPRRLHGLKERGFDPAYFGDEPADVEWVLGACMMIRDDALKAVGLFDSDLSPMINTEEVDWCRRAWKAGWKVAFCPTAQIMHYGGQTWRAERRGIDWMHVEMMRTRLAYFAKHDGRWVASAAASAYALTLPWNALILFQSWVRGRTARTKAWDELRTRAAFALMGAGFAWNLFRRPMRTL